MAAPLGGMGAPHRPGLLRETIEFLDPKRGGLFLDCTVGLGGHSEAILESSEKARVIGFDRDGEALAVAKDRLERFGERFQAVHADFRELGRVMQPRDEAPAGVLADLGVSSLQFDSETRGFSFRFDAPLDMRMDAAGNEATAAQLWRQLSEEESARII